MISRGLYALFTGEPSIQQAAPGGIFPVVLPKATTATAMTYQVVGSQSMPTFETSGMQKLRMQFDCWGQGYEDAAGLRAALIAFFNGYGGELADGTFLQNAELLQQIDFFDQDGRQYRCMAEFYLWYTFPDS